MNRGHDVCLSGYLIALLVMIDVLNEAEAVSARGDMFCTNTRQFFFVVL